MKVQGVPTPSRPRIRHRAHPVVWAFWTGSAAGLGLSVALFLPVSWSSRVLAQSWSDLAGVALSLWATAACFWAAADPDFPRAMRQAMALLGLGALANSAADLLWAMFASGDPDGPAAQLIDATYLLFYPFVLMGLLRIPVAPIGWSERIRLVLDLLTVSVGASMVVGARVLWPQVAAAEDPLGSVLAGALPVGDVVLITGVTLLMMRRPLQAARGPLLGLLAGLTMFVAADLWYGVVGAFGGYDSGHPIDVLWLGGMYAVGIAALALIRSEGDPHAFVDAPRLSPIGLLLPYAALILGFGLVLLEASEGMGDDPSTGWMLVGATTLLGLVVARQSYAMLEIERLSRQVADQFDKLQVETAKSEALLLNVLPGAVAQRLKDHPGESLADAHPAVTVLFADLVGFTSLSAQTSPELLVGLLGEVFLRFDAVAKRHGLEKIKTIGDAYMAVAGIPEAREDHAEAAADMGLDLLRALRVFNLERGTTLELRVGLHSGPVVAGVLGSTKFSYDLWGDTVNTASRMEAHGEPGAVQLSDATAALLAGRAGLVERGVIEVKGKGPMRVWLLRPTASRATGSRG